MWGSLGGLNEEPEGWANIFNVNISYTVFISVAIAVWFKEHSGVTVYFFCQAYQISFSKWKNNKTPLKASSQNNIQFICACWMKESISQRNLFSIQRHMNRWTTWEHVKLNMHCLKCNQHSGFVCYTEKEIVNTQHYTHSLFLLMSIYVYLHILFKIKHLRTVITILRNCETMLFYVFFHMLWSMLRQFLSYCLYTLLKLTCNKMWHMYKLTYMQYIYIYNFILI